MEALPVPNLLGGVAHVWRVNLDSCWPFDFLAPDELKRAGRFKFEKDRQRFVNGRVALRFLLGSYLKKNPAAVRFEYGAAGKPLVEGISFNLAHSGGHGLIAVAAEGQVGVDIEEARVLADMDEVARSVFSAGELARWRGLLSHDKVGAFYRIWTRKEAYLKAVGEGIAHRLQGFEVAFEEGEAPRILSGAEGAWTIEDVSESGELVGAVAVDRADVKVEVMDLGMA